MDFEYVAFNDYIKIARKIEYCGLSEKCLQKLKEMGITRAGEVLACSEEASESYGEDAKWILEAKNFMEKSGGKLDFWEFIEDADDEDDLPFGFDDKDLNDINKPWDIIHYIVEEILHTYYFEYSHNDTIDFSKENLNLSDKAKEKLKNYDHTTFFALFFCYAKRLLLHPENVDNDGNAWDEQSINTIRAFLSNILSLPEGIFEFFDEADEKWHSKNAQ